MAGARCPHWEKIRCEHMQPLPAPPPSTIARPEAVAPGNPLRRSPPPSCAACPGRARPLSAWLRGAPEGATAPRWGRVQRCGEAWPPAGGAPAGAAPQGRVHFLSAHAVRLLNWSPPWPSANQAEPSRSSDPRPASRTPRRLAAPCRRQRSPLWSPQAFTSVLLARAPRPGNGPRLPPLVRRG